MFPDRFIVTSIERIILIGSDEYKENITNFTGKLSSNELIFHLSGKSTIRFNGKVFDIKSDTLRFLPMGENSEYIVDREVHGECIDIFFKSDIELSEAFIADFSNKNNIRAMFGNIFSVWNSKTNGYYFKCMSMLYEIIAEIKKSHYCPNSKSKMIEPAVEYISAKYTEKNIRIGHLAKICGISTSYLQRLFLERFSLTPKKYIIKLKIEKASELLSSGYYSVSKIAEILQYENVYYFSKAFKNETGISPAEYMMKCKSSK